MTKAEYDRLYRQARDTWPGLTRGMMEELGNTYTAAANSAAETVRRATINELSQLTIDSQAALEASLRSGATEIATRLEELMPPLVTDGYASYATIDNRYMMDAIQAAGTAAEGLVTPTGLTGPTVAVNRGLVEAMITRTYDDGFTFSSRIWGDISEGQLPLGVFGDYQYRMKNVVSAGLAQGRDVIKIAKDLQVYVADGKVALVKRYGVLKRGTTEFVKRISGQVDWRALRLARSELYASMQLASLNAGAVNPGATGEFNWVLTPGADHDCVCPDLAAASPYQRDDVPSYPHPNCL
ncbi:MAG: hypothetical protein KAJ19_24860, partial [Gammaproteobacteria bacterium]|nr:hypothetical protein [Gammaproteobacteria bacterium]